jgi:DNA-binding NarL/FixJ family response regulator
MKALLLEVDGVPTNVEIDEETTPMETIRSLEKLYCNVVLKALITEDHLSVLKLLGLHNREIAAIVGMPTRAIEKRIEVLLKKFGKHTRTALAIEVAKYGIYQ